MEFSPQTAPYIWYILQAYGIFMTIIVVGFIKKRKKEKEEKEENEKFKQEVALAVTHYKDRSLDPDDHKISYFSQVNELVDVLLLLRKDKLSLESENKIIVSNISELKDKRQNLIEKIKLILSKTGNIEVENANEGSIVAAIGLKIEESKTKYDDLEKKYGIKNDENHKLRVEQQKLNSMMNVLAETLVSLDLMEYLEELSSAIINLANIDNPDQIILAKGALLESFKKEIEKSKALEKNRNKKQNTTDISAA